MKAALIQSPVYSDKERSVRYAQQAVLQAAADGAELAILPEMFCCPYDNQHFAAFAEPEGGDTMILMSETAKRAGITLVAGSIPERDGETLYNTSFVFNERGERIARHRKVHLFDIDVKGRQAFRESDTFSPGNEITTFECGGHTFGLCICFDIRFPELFRVMALRGAEAVIVPACFNTTTGPMHWELCFRARAVDNQIYTLGVSAARDEKASYVAYGNSIVCDPWANVIARAGTGAEILYAEIDFEAVKSVREQLPFLSARRTDLY